MITEQQQRSHFLAQLLGRRFIDSGDGEREEEGDVMS